MTEGEDGHNWTMVIRPRRSWFDLRFGELWAYRDLVMLFVWRDFVSQYKQTILGPLWYLIQPILTTITFTVIFGRLAGLSTDGVPDFLFYMAGTVVWGYFSACLTKTSNTFTGNAAIFGKVYFPRLAVPVSILFSNLFSFAIQFALFLVVLLWFWVRGAGAAPNLWILAVPLLLFIMAGLGLAMGIIISSLTTRYRDLQFLVAFGAQLLMYATPVIYPLSSLPEDYRWIMVLNPMTSIVEAFRFVCLGSGSFELVYLAYSAVVMVVALLLGAMLFNRVEQTFMDTV